MTYFNSNNNHGDARVLPLNIMGTGAISGGLVADYTIVHKFGRIQGATSGSWQNVWDGGGLYPYKFTENIIAPFIISTSTGDVGKTVSVTGINSDFEVVTEDVELNGTIAVPLTKDFMIIYRVKNIGNGNDQTGSLAGNVTVEGTGADVGKVYGKIIFDTINLYNQTNMALFVIPKDYVGIIKTYGLSNSDRDCKIAQRTKKIGEPFQTKRVADAVNTMGQIDINQYYDEKTIIDIMCYPSQTSEISAWFDIVLIKKTEFEKSLK